MTRGLAPALAMTALAVALTAAIYLTPRVFGQSVPSGSGGGGVATVAAGAGVSVSTASGTATVTNTGVTSLAAGSSNVTVSAASGAVSVNMASAIAPTTLSIGGGTTITGLVVYVPSITPSQIAAALGAAEQTFSVTGLATSDKVFVSAPAGQTALCPLTSARVSTTNTLALTFSNLAVALCTPVSGTYTVLAIRS